MRKRELVILDRDGVINFDSAEYIKNPDEWRAIPGSAAAIGRLTRAGFTVAVATNQSGVGRGLLDRAALYRIHRKMRRVVGAAGGRIDRIVFCPHRPDEGCACRKPSPELLNRLLMYYGVTPDAAVAIGDSTRDIEAARRAGVMPWLVLTGNGSRSLRSLDLGERYVFADLAEAADALLSAGID